MLCLSLNLPSIQYKDKTDTNLNNYFLKIQELKYTLHFLLKSYLTPPPPPPKNPKPPFLFPKILKSKNNSNIFYDF